LYLRCCDEPVAFRVSRYATNMFTQLRLSLSLQYACNTPKPKPKPSIVPSANPSAACVGQTLRPCHGPQTGRPKKHTAGLVGAQPPASFAPAPVTALRACACVVPRVGLPRAAPRRASRTRRMHILDILCGRRFSRAPALENTNPHAMLVLYCARDLTLTSCVPVRFSWISGLELRSRPRCAPPSLLPALYPPPPSRPLCVLTCVHAVCLRAVVRQAIGGVGANRLHPQRLRRPLIQVRDRRAARGDAARRPPPDALAYSRPPLVAPPRAEPQATRGAAKSPAGPAERRRRPPRERRRRHPSFPPLTAASFPLSPSPPPLCPSRARR
jgi:hypothetical protein